MSKFASHSKGKPSKRRTLKVKYKIERRVKQHNKRVRKEAKKLKSNGLRHKKTSKGDTIPNIFPYKQQMLDDHKKTLPQTEEIQLNIIDQTSYGLLNLQNKCKYLSKPKDNLIKKYVTNLEHTLSNVQIVIQLLDAKNPEICIDREFRSKCQKNNLKVISVLTKTDTVSKELFANSLNFVRQNCETVISFSCDQKKREQSTSQLMTALKLTTGGNVLVAGKKFTGKHSLITTMAKAARCYQENPCELQVFKLDTNIRLLDSPILIEDTADHPMFNVPNPLIEESLQAQEEKALRRLFIGEGKIKGLFNRDEVLEHFQIQDYTTVTDFISKVGRASRFFGKGGSIDSVRVRTKVLSDWFGGKLNYLME